MQDGLSIHSRSLKPMVSSFTPDRGRLKQVHQCVFFSGDLRNLRDGFFNLRDQNRDGSISMWPWLCMIIFFWAKRSPFGSIFQFWTEKRWKRKSTCKLLPWNSTPATSSSPAELSSTTFQSIIQSSSLVVYCWGYHLWLVVYIPTPLKNIWVLDIKNINMEKKIHVPNHQPDISFDDVWITTWIVGWPYGPWIEKLITIWTHW